MRLQQTNTNNKVLFSWLVKLGRGQGDPHSSTVIVMILKRSPEQYTLSLDFTCYISGWGSGKIFVDNNFVFVVNSMLWKAPNKTQKPRNLGINQKLSRNLHNPSRILKSPWVSFLKLKTDMIIIGICNFSYIVWNKVM